MKPVARIPTDALNAVRHAEALGHREGQRQRHSPAQTTPQNGHPVWPFDRRRQLQCRHGWQEREQNDRPRRDGGNDHDANQGEILEAHPLEQAWDQKGCQDEDQRTGPMRQDIPQFAQVRPGLRRQPTGSGEIQRQAGSDHGDDARRADALLRADVGEVGKCNRNGDLRQFVAPELRHEPDRQPRSKPARKRPACDQYGKAREGLGQVRVWDSEHDEAHEQAEECNRRSVVQKALAFDDPRKPARRRD